MCMLVCIDEQRNNSIRDAITGQVRDFEAKELNDSMKHGMIQVISLKLTHDNDTSHKYDGAGISMNQDPVYTNKQQEYISKPMNKKVGSKKSAFYIIENMFSIFEKPIFKNEKELTFGDRHDYASYDEL